MGIYIGLGQNQLSNLLFIKRYEQKTFTTIYPNKCLKGLIHVDWFFL